MKPFFLLLLIAFSFSANSQKVLSPITCNDPGDDYATHDALLGKGGYRSVATIADRDAITTLRKSEGMKVFVVADSTEYRWIGGNWITVNYIGTNLANSALTANGNYTHNWSGNNLTINSINAGLLNATGSFRINNTNGTRMQSMILGGTRSQLESTNSATSKTSGVYVNSDSIQIKAQGGRVFIDSLPYSNNSSLRMIVYDSNSHQLYRTTQSGAGDLQTVTDNGYTTTNGITVGSLISTAEIESYARVAAPILHILGPNRAILKADSLLTDDRTFQFQDKSGTVALLDDITTPTPAYANYYEASSQTFASSSVPSAVSLTNTVVQSGISQSGGEITFTNAGVYEVKYSANATASGGANLEVRMQKWNGSSWDNIAGTKIAFSMASGDMENASNAYIFTALAGDKIRFAGTSTNDTLIQLASGNTDYSFSTSIHKL